MKRIIEIIFVLVCFSGMLTHANAVKIGNATEIKKSAIGTIDCVFPGTTEAAPGWVCDAPVAGYEITAVGSVPNAGNSRDNKLPPLQHALLNAIVKLTSSLKVMVVNDAKSGKSKQVQNSKVGSNLSVTSYTKGYSDSIGEGKDKVEVKVLTISSKLVMAQPCEYMMKSSVESTTEGGRESLEVVSDETGNQCTIQDVVKELSSSGLDVVETVKDTRGNLFLLLGAKKISAIKIPY